MDIRAEERPPPVLLITWQGVSSLSSWPHYLPYFNEFAAGAGRRGELLDDSNLDWGQDLKALPAVLKRHEIDSVNLCYFGMADAAYYGLSGPSVHPSRLADPAPGVYAVSLHYLIRLLPTGESWLNTRRPFAKAGTSIWLYRVP